MTHVIWPRASHNMPVTRVEHLRRCERLLAQRDEAEARIRELTPPPPTRKGRPPNPNEAEILADTRNGDTHRTVADRYGISMSRVAQIVAAERERAKARERARSRAAEDESLADVERVPSYENRAKRRRAKA